MSLRVPVLGVGERLDRLTLSRSHYLILILLGATLFFDNFESFMSGAVLGAMVDSGFSDAKHNVYFLAATYGGFAIGAFTSGALSERFGSRILFTFNLLLLGVSSFACYFATDFSSLSGYRLLTGFAMGGEFVVSLALLVEFMPKVARARSMATIGLVMGLTAFVANYVAFQVIPGFGWRYMFVIPGAGALLLLLLRFWVPESPRWLSLRGRYDDAEKVLRRIEGDQYQPCELKRSADTQNKGEMPISGLFRGEMKMRTFVACVMATGVSFGGFTFSSWLPTFLVERGFSVDWALGFTTIVSLGIPVGALAGIILGNRLGRKASMTIAIAIATLAISAYPFAGTAAIAAALGFIFSAGAYFVGMNVNFYVNEIFPTGYRYRGGGLAQSTAKIFTVASPFLVGAIYEAVGEGASIGLIAAAFIIMGLVLSLWGTETMAQSLDEVAPDETAESAVPAEA